jgi:glycosyltransferase involved in cell wall biosynthesis
LAVAESTGAVVIDLPYNLGIGGAVQTGFIYAFENGYDVAIQIDGDGQHDPKFIPAMIAPITAGTHDVVIGSRFLDDARSGFQSTFLRRIGIRVFEWINSVIIRQRITDNTSGYRAFSRKAIELLSAEYPADYPEPESVIALGLRKFRIAEIPVVMRERQGGKSSIHSWISAYYMVKVLLAIFVNVFKKRD